MSYCMKCKLLVLLIVLVAPNFAIGLSSPPVLKPIDPRPEALNCGTVAAKARCLSVKHTPEYYVDQSIKYFLTMASSVSVFVQPNYSSRVVRWEWEPWLLLTGYGRFNLIWTDILLKLYPTAYSMMNCQAFDVQPFARCHVIFDYSGSPCPIYEEFTFNDRGEITFIEAWSDYPSLLPMDSDDYWAERDNVKRLSTKVPGLGNKKGKIKPRSPWMRQAALYDDDVANLRSRVKRPYISYFKELSKHVSDVLAGCEPPQ